MRHMKRSLRIYLGVFALALIVITGCHVPDNDAIQSCSWLRRVLTRSLAFSWKTQIGDPFGLTLFNFGEPYDISEPEDENKSSQTRKLEQLSGWKTIFQKPEHHLMIKSVRADYVGHTLTQVLVEYNDPSRENAERMASELKKHFQLSPDSYDEVRREATGEKGPIYSLEFIGHPKPESWARLEWKEDLTGKAEMFFCWRGLLPVVPQQLWEHVCVKIIPYLENVFQLEYPDLLSASVSFNGYRMAKADVVDIVATVESRGSDGGPMTTRWGIRAAFDEKAESFVIKDAIKLMDNEKSYERASLRASGSEGSWSMIKLSFCEPQNKVEDNDLPPVLPPPEPETPPEEDEAPEQSETRDLFELSAFGMGSKLSDVRRNSILTEQSKEKMNWRILDLKPERPDIKSEVVLFMNSDTVNGMEVTYERQDTTLSDVVKTLVNDYDLAPNDYCVLDNIVLFHDAPNEGCCGYIRFEPLEILCYVRMGEPEVPKEVQREVYNAAIDHLYSKLPPNANVHKYDEKGTDFQFEPIGMARSPEKVEVRFTVGVKGKFQYWCFLAEYENNELVEPKFGSEVYEKSHLVQVESDERNIQQADFRKSFSLEEQKDPDFKKHLSFLGL